MDESRFSIVEDLVAPGEAGSNYHLVDYQTQELVSTLWSKYLRQVTEGLAPTPVGPVMRRASYSLDNDCMPGRPLRRGIRVVSRSRRACTFEAALWRADDGKAVHVAELVTVFVDPARGSVEIPEDFWAAVEQFEGHSIPVAARPAVAAPAPG